MNIHKAVKGLIALAKAKPGQLSYGSAGSGAINHLTGEINKIIKAPDMRTRMIEFGYEPVGGPPEKFGEHIHAEIAKWAPVVKAAGVKVD